MATRADIYASARWQARQVGGELDPLTAARWAGCLARGWRRLWAVHPEAFHVGGDLVGDLPALPAGANDALPIDETWVDVLGAGVAADALRGFAVEGAPAQGAGAPQPPSQELEARFMAGLGG